MLTLISGNLINRMEQSQRINNPAIWSGFVSSEHAHFAFRVKLNPSVVIIVTIVFVDYLMCPEQSLAFVRFQSFPKILVSRVKTRVDDLGGVVVFFVA